MANRSYLYSSNLVPSPDISKDERRIVGISEWNYYVPIVFKILLSGNPRKCRSSIWEFPEEVAIVGDYNQGISHLFSFLDRLSNPAILPLRDDAREFLTAEENRNSYFVLECGEIFEMGDEPLAKQNCRLLAEIQNLDPIMEAAVAALSETHEQSPKSLGFFAKVLGAEPTLLKKEEPTEAIYSLGLGNWSNILYFDLRNP